MFAKNTCVIIKIEYRDIKLIKINYTNYLLLSILRKVFYQRITQITRISKYSKLAICIIRIQFFFEELTFRSELII